MSNRRKIRASRPTGSRPRCADCRATVRTTTDAAGRTVVRVAHHPACPAWNGTTPNAVLDYARGRAAAGQRVMYVKTPGLPEGWPA